MKQTKALKTIGEYQYDMNNLLGEGTYAKVYPGW